MLTISKTITHYVNPYIIEAMKIDKVSLITCHISKNDKQFSANHIIYGERTPFKMRS